MNAYELHEAAFDSACDYAEDSVEYIRDYADGAFGIYVSDGICERILECRKAYREATDKNGEGQNNAYHLIQVPLQSIEL